MIATKKIIKEKLVPQYGSAEADSLTRLILEHVTDLSVLQMHLFPPEPLPESKIVQIMEIVNRLLLHEPIQYILGETEFFGLKFYTSPGVLIPRPETEELVDWIIAYEKDRCQSLLDIGTGSGCITISINKNTGIDRIDGWDISETALKIARKNALRNDSKVIFSCQDILNPAGVADNDKWDVIVSNPPYVLQEEAILMGKNVVDFEPHLALFVPDEDPLLFYRAIAKFAAIHLETHGSLYFEINEKMGEPLVQLLREYGFQEILTRKDLQGKDRMMRARRDVK